MSAEQQRLAEDEARTKYWRRWGPYLAERAWGTVREDYSADGDAWNYFTRDQARSRAYRWTEDGILGICDNHQRLCFALAFWNGKDPYLKERLFGLSGKEGNHGEDVKELYYYLDATPTASYLKGLYKYPQELFPYDVLLQENLKRSKDDPEYEIQDTGIFSEGRYFDIFGECAKHDANDILIRVTIANRGPEAAGLTFLPTLWFRNTWSWSKEGEAGAKPKLTLTDGSRVHAAHNSLGNFVWELDGTPEVLFTENESDVQALWGLDDSGLHHKDAFHKYLVQGVREAVNPEREGTKCCAVYPLSIGPGEERELLFRLAPEDAPSLPREQWSEVFHLRIREADEFYAPHAEGLGEDAANVQRQAFAGLFWSKQFYHLVVETWLNGDPDVLQPPEQRKLGRNHSWRELFNEDIISMPDKWEYPWYAAWDLAFHTVAIAAADPDFSKGQLLLFLREWYMHPNGQIPAYEWAFGDVNPPVHAWACWRVFEIDKRVKGKPDYPFLERVFHKLLMNFTWWVNRKDSEGANIFEGGFLGLDNIGVFNRSEDLPPGWLLEQSDGSSWMAMYCLNMLKIALTLSAINPVYEDIASKFFEHFLYIADAVNHHLDTGLWDEEDGFYYDRLRTPGHEYIRMRVRSLVGIVPLFATDTLEEYLLDRHRGFRKRMKWFIANRGDLTEGLASLTEGGVEHRRLLSVVNRQRLQRILQRVFDEDEFLSPYGVRSVSRYHKDHPYELQLNGHSSSITYEPAESKSGLFGGNSNWRGPVWMPMNFLVIEALNRLDHYYGDSIKVEFPTRSGQWVTLRQGGRLLSERLSGLFLRGPDGQRPIYGENELLQHDCCFKDLLQFHEYFHGDSGKGLGASHQTGWTGLIAKLL